MEPSEASPVQLRNGAIEIVGDFTYLGSNISDDGEVTVEVSTRLGKASGPLDAYNSPSFATTA